MAVQAALGRWARPGGNAAGVPRPAAAIGRRDLAMLSLLAWMGLRGEVAGLAPDDIDWRNGGLR